MLRQLSTTKLSILKSRYKENIVVRFSSTNNILFYGRKIIDRRQQRPKCYFYNIRNKIHHNFYRDHPSFHHLRARYFSNMVQQSHNDDDNVDENSVDKDIDDDNHISMRLTRLPGNDNNYKFRHNLNSWYLTHHGEIGGCIRNAFVTEFVANPNRIKVINEDKNFVDVPKQLWTAKMTCPITNEKFEAGRLPGYFDVGGRNYYSKKKIALEAVSAVSLGHKMAKNDDNNDDDDNKNGDIGNDDQYLALGLDESTIDRDTFRQILERMYMKHFKVNASSRQFRIFKQDFVGKTRGGTWWTSEITCPITNQTYEASDLSGQGVSEFMMMNEAGRIWYRKKSDSVHAAAYTAIESVNWDGEQPEEGESSITTNSLNESLDGKGKTNVTLETLRPLIFWYAEYYNTNISIEDNFVLTGSDDGGNKWTASFVCPLTGERFDSGTLNINVIRSNHGDIFKWYTKKDTAIQAAALKAYDVFKYRETGTNDPRFCKENPTDFVSETSSLLATQKLEYEDDSDDYLSIREKVDDEPIPDTNVERNESAHEDDYVIELIPQQLNIAKGLSNVSSKTLDIIAQTWIDSTGAPNDVQKNEHGIENLQNSLIERQKAISRALEWVSRQKKKKEKPLSDRIHFDFEGHMCNLKIANIILSSLAETHQSVPFDAQSNGVEECAAAILESNWSSHSSVPDAQSYAFYLKCLEGETPRDVAARAQEIVNAMESGDDYNGRKLPKPDVSVYSNLTQLNALSGINSSIGSSNMNPSRVHRNIYLSELSAMAHDPSTFDIDLAMKHIDQMGNSAELNTDSSLQPDIEVYNAPLRWSGGPLWSRHYSRVIPWDSYSEIYQYGFKPECDVDVERKQAEEIERWIEIMKTKALDDSNLAPNIETYESLIQAWVRCGNLQSLLHAETCAKDLLITCDDLGVRPRLHTFYPIIAAWVYSGCAEGPQNVESWIDILQELVPELEPRLSFPNLPIMAQISLQRQMLNRSSDHLETTALIATKDSIADMAAKCSKLLDSTVDRYKASPDFIIQSDMFILVIHAWHNAGKAVYMNDDYDENKYLKEMEKTVNLFDDLLVWLYQKDTDRAKSQLLNLLECAPSIYGAELAAVKKMDRNIKKSQNRISNYFGITKHLVSIEEKIRRLENFNLFLEDDDADTVGGITQFSQIVHGAASAFPSEAFSGNPSCNCWSDYIDLTLTVLDEGTYDYSIGEADFIRLCLLITRVTSSTPPAVLSPIEKERIIEKVVKLLKNYCQQNRDREAVISTVIRLLENGSGTLGNKAIKDHHAIESQYKNKDEILKVNNYESDVTNINKRRKVRRRRPRGNDVHRGSRARSKVPTNRPWRRRPHHLNL